MKYTLGTSMIMLGVDKCHICNRKIKLNVNVTQVTFENGTTFKLCSPRCVGRFEAPIKAAQAAGQVL